MFHIRSTAFDNQEEIPTKYTCEGEDISPPLEWGSPPKGTRSFALIVDDPDAPDPGAPKMVWVHWVLFNLPPNGKGLAEGAPSADLPEGTCQGLNDWKRAGWGGPCPPIGRHRYFFHLYALDSRIDVRGRLTRAQLDQRMRGHVLADAVLMGTYQKKRA
ncbi:MAG: YbhB/YbcL family Raf kinase inhibitor-like protein [Polyangiales bacterium]